ncbi:MAG: transcriptional regulator [Gammaproteobacteria bacterium]
MLVHAKIQKWGNGLALRVSGVMRDIPNFHEGSEVDIEVTEKGLNITKTTAVRGIKWPFSEAQLLQGLNPSSGHADVIANQLSEAEYGDND